MLTSFLHLLVNKNKIVKLIICSEMFCFKCGAQLQNGAKYCMMCGQQIPQTETPNKECIENSYIDTVKANIPFIYDSIFEIGKDYPYLYTTRDNFKGIVSLDANTIIPCIYNEIKPYFYANNNLFAYAEVRVGSKWGFHNGRREIIPPVYESLQRESGIPFYQCFIDSQIRIVNYASWTTSPETYDNVIHKEAKCFTYRDNLVGIYEYKTNKQIIPCDYNDIETTDRTNIYKTYKINKVGIYDTSLGEAVVPCNFDKVIINHNGTYKVYSENRVGLYTNNGLVIRCEYDDITIPPNESWGYKLLLNGKFALTGDIFKKFPKFTYCDIEELHSEETIRGTYDHIFKISNGKLWGLYKSSITYGYYGWNKFPDEIQYRMEEAPSLDFYRLADIEFKYDFVEKIDDKRGVYKCSKNNFIGLLNEKLEEILDFSYNDIEIANGYTILKKNGKKGIMNMFPCEYDEIITDCESEYIILKSNGKVGVYSRLEHVFISKFEYDKVEHVDHAFIVWNNNKCGIMGPSGHLWSEVIYDNIKYANFKYSPFRFIAQKNQKYSIIGIRKKIEYEYDSITYCPDTDMVKFLDDSKVIEITSEELSARYKEYIVQRRSSDSPEYPKFKI